MKQDAACLESFLNPSSIAVIGASPDSTRIRGALLANAIGAGYRGKLLPVNPSYTEISGLRCYPDIKAIGEPVDLALIAIPAEEVPKAVRDCAEAGTRHALVVSSGFAEEQRSDLQGAIARIAERTGIRVCGPNAEGFYSEVHKIAATFSHVARHVSMHRGFAATTRRVGVVAQSGGIGFSLFMRGRDHGLAFSHVITTGNEVDLTAADFLAYMAEDKHTSAILLFLESVRDPEGFIAAAARAAELRKPIVVIKVGRSLAGERATASHTASMAGWGKAYEAVFRTFGFLEASDPADAVAILGALTTCPLPAGARAGLVSVSGGAGAWMTDTATAAGLDVPELSPALQARLRPLVPSYGSVRNPVDITAQMVHPAALLKAIEYLVASDEIDVVVAVASLSTLNRKRIDPAALRPLIEAQKKPVLFYSYTEPSPEARAGMAEAAVVVESGMHSIGNALRQLLRFSRFTPPPARRVAVDASSSVARLLSRLGATPTEHEAKAVLAAHGVCVASGVLATTEAELLAGAARLGFPLAAKIQSPDIQHKTEVGGVRLNLRDAESLCAAWNEMHRAAASRAPGAKIAGVLLEPMAPPGVEIIVGVIRDAIFGPIVMVGAGGVMTELFADVSYRLAPVSTRQALEMIAELNCRPLLDGFRGAAALDKASLARLIEQVSWLAYEQRDMIREIEINPVIVHAAGSFVADALIALQPVKR